jgi:hypothetical protein
VILPGDCFSDGNTYEWVVFLKTNAMILICAFTLSQIRQYFAYFLHKYSQNYSIWPQTFFTFFINMFCRNCFQIRHHHVCRLRQADRQERGAVGQLRVRLRQVAGLVQKALRRLRAKESGPAAGFPGGGQEPDARTNGSKCLQVAMKEMSG